MAKKESPFERIKRLISCVNKEDPYNKIYSITNKGLKALQRLKKIEK